MAQVITESLSRTKLPTLKPLLSSPPKALAGSPVVKVVDYNQPEQTGLPKSNVLQFFSADGCKVTVRPSGTEPKIKFYFSACGADADKRNQALREQFSA